MRSTARWSGSRATPAISIISAPARAPRSCWATDGCRWPERIAAIDLIVIDAFSSDAIPTHLLTREALALYLRKLRPGGVILFNLSNKYLELTSVVTAVADNLQLVSAVKDHASAT